MGGTIALNPPDIVHALAVPSKVYPEDAWVAVVTHPSGSRKGLIVPAFSEHRPYGSLS
jgi:hypothetical protein